jgi:dihydroflavonol-4-reductase
VRPSSSTEAFADAGVTIIRGELTDTAALRAAMSGVDAVHYCIVDTRAWLRDPAPLFHTNVQLLGNVVDAAVEVGVPRFVFCSTVGTIGISHDGPADETTPHNWRKLGGPYIEARLQAEELVLEAHRTRGLPAVVLNVGTTYGPNDLGPTPHGKMVRAAAVGKVAAYVKGASMEVVAIDDAAAAFPLAEERGRLGERYVISERYLSIQDLFTIAASETNAKPPRIGIPLPVMRAIGTVSGLVARVQRKDAVINSTSVRLMHIQSALDHSKATAELGWEPSPTPEAIRAGARYFAALPR